MLFSLPKKQLIPVIAVSFIASTLNLLDIIFWAFHVPQNTIYLMVGHYFPDYLAYLQVMAQGQNGRWLVENPYTTDEVTSTFLGWWPDLAIGKLGGWFHLSPQISYWLAVWLFSFVLALLLFAIIRTIFRTQPFFFSFAAFLLILFSTPFYGPGLTKFVPYDYWYAPTSLFNRFGSVPRHILDQIIVLSVFLFLSKVLSRLSKMSYAKVFASSLVVSFAVILLSFFSLHSIILCFVLFFVGAYYILNGFLKHKILLPRLFALFAPIAAFTIPAGLFIQSLSSSVGPLARSAAWDLNQQAAFTPAFFLLLSGPILIFALLGLPSFVKNPNPMKIIFLALALFTLIILYSPLAPYLGTPSIRLFSPLEVITLAALAIFGAKFLAGRLKAKPGLTIAIVTFLLLAYSVPANIFFYKVKINEDKKSLYFFNYFPQEFQQAIKHLDTDPTPGAVLTRPEGWLGLAVPIFSRRHVYIGRHFLTNNFEAKSKYSSDFFRGLMPPNAACKFLTDNHIAFVLWTVWDGTADPKPNLPCLAPFYENSKSLILKYK